MSRKGPSLGTGNTDVSDLLDRMRRNPAADWTIPDVETVCAQHGVRCTPPCGRFMTIPRARPVEPVYIRELVRFIEAVGGADAPS